MTTRIIGRYWVQNGSKEYRYMRGYLEGPPITLAVIQLRRGFWGIHDPTLYRCEDIKYRALGAAKAVVAQKHGRKK
jgi:hypothetical protein